MENSIELQTRLRAHTGSASSQAPENWETLVGEIMMALMPFEDARKAVVAALAQSGKERQCPTCGRVDIP